MFFWLKIYKYLIIGFIKYKIKAFIKIFHQIAYNLKATFKLKKLKNHQTALTLFLNLLFSTLTFKQLLSLKKLNQTLP